MSIIELFYHFCVVALGFSLGFVFFRLLLSKKVQDAGIKKVVYLLALFFATSGPIYSVYQLLEKGYVQQSKEAGRLGAGASLLTYLICFVGGIGLGSLHPIWQTIRRDRFEFLITDVFPDLHEELNARQVKALVLWAKRRKESWLSRKLRPMGTRFGLFRDEPNHYESLGQAFSAIKAFFSDFFAEVGPDQPAIDNPPLNPDQQPLQ